MLALSLLLLLLLLLMFIRCDTGQEWEGCKGSKPERRGYTCGLWLLLHSLAAESQPEETGGSFWMTAVRCCALILSNCCKLSHIMHVAC